MIDYLVSLAAFAALYAILALGLNAAWGMTGLINLGLAGFFALGAYGTALATVGFHFAIVVGIGIGVVLAGIGGAIVALAAVRLRGDYLAIVTLGFAEIVRLVATNETWLTRGADGISGIPGPYRAQLGPHGFDWLSLGLIASVLGFVYVLMERLRTSPYGRTLRAIRDDDEVALIAGKPVVRFKFEIFVVGAGIIGLAGALFAHYTSYISPENFTPLVTIYAFLALTAGGTGSNRGAVVGGFIVIFLLESTRFIAGVIPGVSAVQAAALRGFLIGAGLLLVMHVRPNGVFPEQRR